LAIECTEIAQIAVKNASIWRMNKCIALPILMDGLIQRRLFDDASTQNHIEKLKNQPRKLAKLISHKVPVRNLPTSPKLIDEIVCVFNGF